MCNVNTWRNSVPFVLLGIFGLPPIHLKILLQRDSLFPHDSNICSRSTGEEIPSNQVIHPDTIDKGLFFSTEFYPENGNSPELPPGSRGRRVTRPRRARYLSYRPFYLGPDVPPYFLGPPSGPRTITSIKVATFPFSFPRGLARRHRSESGLYRRRTQWWHERERARLRHRRHSGADHTRAP